jgi:hypothetical protein
MALRYWVSGGTGNWNSTTNWSTSSGGASGASVPGTSDDAVFDANSGAGNAIINVATANVISINFTGFTGTLRVNNTLSASSVTLGTGMSFDTTSGTPILRLGGNTGTYTSNGVTWPYTLDTGTGAQTITFSGNATVQNFNRRSTITSILTLNGSTLTINGDLSSSGSGIGGATGTANIVLAGTGTWSHVGSGAWRINLTINTAGTITISGSVYYNTGTLTYTAGTVITTGSTLVITLSTTLSTNGITWNDINSSIGGAATLTLTGNLAVAGIFLISSGTLTFSSSTNSINITTLSFSNGSGGLILDKDITITNFIKTSGAAGNPINNHNITITGNIDTGNATASKTGTTNIIYAGTGTWSGTATGDNFYGFSGGDFTINTAGTLSLSGNIGIVVGKNFTYVAGTIIDLGYTLIFGGPGTSNIDISGFGTIPELRVVFGSSSGVILNLISNLVVGNLFINVAGPRTFNTSDIIVLGNISLAGTSRIEGSSKISYQGTGTISNSSTASIATLFEINTSGTLTFNGNNYFGSTSTGLTYEIEYISGTVVTTGSTLIISAPNNGTFKLNSGSIIWNNVTVVLTTNITLELDTQVVCQGTLSMPGSTTFSGADGTFDVGELLIPGGGVTWTLIAAENYIVRTNFERTFTVNNTSTHTIRSSSTGTKAILTLDPGATQDLRYISTIDIDSSLGKTIYSYKSTSFTNTDNWAALPTDPTISAGGETAHTFIS